MKYLQFIKEHKFWGKTNREFLEWMKSKSDRHFVFIDTETTGLPSDPYEIQLTQVSCLVTEYDFGSNRFEEIDSYDKKIKLTPETLGLMNDPTTRIKKVLSFNHYGKKGVEYHPEGEVLEDFFKMISKYRNPMLVIQNAEFDMRFLNTRNPIVRFENEVLDTKQVAQLFYLPTLQKLSETETSAAEMIRKIGTSDRDNGLISSSLSKIGPALGINMTNYHDALTDCRLAVQMLERMIDFIKDHQDVDIRKYQAERIMTKR